MKKQTMLTGIKCLAVIFMGMMLVSCLVNEREVVIEEIEEINEVADEKTAETKQSKLEAVEELSLEQRLEALIEKYGEDPAGEAFAMDGVANEAYQKGDYETALKNYQGHFEIWQVLIQDNPENALSQNNWAWSHVTMGRVCAKQGKKEKANDLWTKAVKIIEPVTADNPDNLYYLDTHAQALLNLGRVEDAKPLVTKLLELGNDDAEFLALCRKHGLINVS